MPSPSSRSAPKKRNQGSSPVVLEQRQPIPPQRSVRSTKNYAEQLTRLKTGQCYRIKDYDLFMRMRAAAHTQNSKRGAAFVCRWIGAFGRIWNAEKQKPKAAKR